MITTPNGPTLTGRAVSLSGARRMRRYGARRHVLACLHADERPTRQNGTDSRPTRALLPIDNGQSMRHDGYMTTTTRSPLPVPSVDAILHVYRSATDSQMRRGVDWYGDAHALCRSLDPADPRRAAGIIAALSPQTPWGRNVALAARVYSEGFASGTMKRAIAAANAIYNGADVDSVLKGPKIRAFAATIADPTDPRAVVVDRHAFSIAVGHPCGDDELSALNRKGCYELFADAYREAAAIVGVAPSVMQAVTWVVWRETEIRCAAAMRREAGEES